jgi:hypothetical protein
MIQSNKNSNEQGSLINPYVNYFVHLEHILSLPPFEKTKLSLPPFEKTKLSLPPFEKTKLILPPFEKTKLSLPPFEKTKGVKPYFPGEVRILVG